MKTIKISEETYKSLIELKLKEGNKNIEEIIANLIIEHKKMRFSKASNLFNKKLRERKIPFKTLLKRLEIS